MDVAQASILFVSRAIPFHLLLARKFCDDVQTRHCFPPRVANLYVIIAFPRISMHLPGFEA